ncbi:hypothetical protein HS125_21280, partial [bacterium]|nr:hypothetical protein [bacterium]
MSIESRIRILWGALGLLVTLLLLSLAYGATAGDEHAPALATSSSEPDYGPVVRANLLTVARGISAYRISHADEYPPSLSMLYPTYISDPTVFWNPGDNDPCPTTINNDEPDQPNSTQVSFLYLQAWGRHGLVLQDSTPANNQSRGLYVINFESPSTVVFFEPSPSPPSWMQAVRTNLQQLGLALSAYASDNDGQYPDRLSRLYPSYASDPLLFWNPNGISWYDRPAPQTIDNDVPGRINSAQISYAYLGLEKHSNCSPDTILLQDRSPLNNGGVIISTLTVDMAVTTWLESESRCVSPPNCGLSDLLQLRGLISAMQVYATANSDDFPTRLSMLYGRNVDHPGFFWAHGDVDSRPLVIDTDEPNQPSSAQVSYAYFKTGYADLNVVLHDNTLTNNGGEGLHVATRDGTTRFFKRSGRMLPSTAVAKSHLLQLGQALKAYAASNDGRYPQLLSSLYPAYIADPTAFWNPGDKDACPTSIDEDGVNRSNSAQVSFNYLGAPYREGDDPGIVLLADNSLANNGGTGILVLTADYLVDYFAPTFPSRDEAMVCANIARSNLRKVYYALRAYEYGHSGRLPLTLSALQLQREPLRPSDFWNPGDSDEYPPIITNDVLDQAESAQISFEYLAGGEVLDDLPPDAVLMQDNTPANNGGDGKLVLRADGHIDFEYMRRVASLSMIGPETIPENGTAAYTCTASFDDGTVRDVTGESEWSMIRALGYFEGQGAYRAVLPVSADTPTTLRVQYVDQGGAAFDAQKTITVQNTVRVLTDLAITAGPATVGEGETAAYTCTATYDDGGTQDVTAQAVWSVSSGPGSFSSAGTYVAPATVLWGMNVTLQVSFTHDGVTRQATKGILVANTVHIFVGIGLPQGPATLGEGESGSFVCFASYDDATYHYVTAEATWEVISGPGSFTSPGTYAAPQTVTADTPVTIRATYSEQGITKQASRQLTVLNSVRILASLSISSGPAVV